MSVLQSFCRLVLDLEHMRESFALERKSANGEPGYISEMNQNSMSLLSLLRRFRNRKASDPRDKVYALLSLVKTAEHRSALEPNYALDEREVFKLAAIKSIYDSASLSVLHTDVQRKYRHDLPSWVPDWEAPDFGHNFGPD